MGTRLTTEFESHEHNGGITDAFRKIQKEEGFLRFYAASVGVTLLVAILSFAISSELCGSLKEHTLGVELFFCNLRRVDADSGELSDSSWSTSSSTMPR